LNLVQQLFVFGRVAATCGAVLVLNACMSMSADDCAKADWSRRGQRAAMNNLPLEEGLKRMNERCTVKHSIKPDEDAYRAGHAEGQKTLCVAAEGTSDGQNGRPRKTVCTQPPQPLYLEAHEQGVRFYCRPRNAYDHARAGGENLLRCPESQASAFATAYKLGREVYDNTKKADEFKSRASSDRYMAADTKRKMEERNAALRRALEAEDEERKLRITVRQIEVQATALPN
jgi:hypothetical protein